MAEADPKSSGSAATTEKKGEGFAATGKGRVKEYKEADVVQYPSESLFQAGERVFVVEAGSRGVRGPCMITAVLGGERYMLKEETSEVQFESSGESMQRRL